MPATLARVSVSVWLSPAAHTGLAAVAAAEGVSAALLGRRAAAVAVEAPGGRVAMASPTAEAVDELRAGGYELNRLLPAAVSAVAGAQQDAIAARMTAALERIITAARGVQLTGTVSNGGGAGADGGEREGWRLLRVTAAEDAAQMWVAATKAAGFRSPANWLRDALAGLYGLAVARPPAPVTIDARAVAGRVLGLVAQTETVGFGRELDRSIDMAADALYGALESLVAYGGDPKARR